MCVKTGMFVVIVLRIRLLRNSTGLHNNGISLYDEEYVGVLLGFSMGIVLAFLFRYLGYCCTLCMVKDVSEAPYGYWPKVFHVPVG